MSDVTTNYNLKKPLGSENYNILDQNGNMDILDAQIKTDADNIATHTSQLAESVTKTLTDITYYVATTGSDTTGDGTSG